MASKYPEDAESVGDDSVEIEVENDEVSLDLTEEEQACIADWTRGDDEGRPEDRERFIVTPRVITPRRFERPLTDAERVVREALEVAGYFPDPCKTPI